MKVRGITLVAVFVLTSCGSDDTGVGLNQTTWYKFENAGKSGGLDELLIIDDYGVGYLQGYNSGSRRTNDDEKIYFHHETNVLRIQYTSAHSYGVWTDYGYQNVTTWDACLRGDALYLEMCKRVGGGAGIDGHWRNVNTVLSNEVVLNRKTWDMRIAGTTGIITNTDWTDYYVDNLVMGVSNVVALGGGAYQVIYWYYIAPYTNYYVLDGDFLYRTNTAEVYYRQ